MRISHNKEPLYVCDFCGQSASNTSLHLASYTHAAICGSCRQGATPIVVVPPTDTPEADEEAAA
jgi:hypothetical protein